MASTTPIDLNLDKQTVTITIAALPKLAKEGAKVQFVGVKEHKNQQLKIWVSDIPKLAQSLEVGATAEAEIEVKATNDGGKEIWIRSFGGPTKGTQRGGNGGGRSYTPIPKTSDEIHSASIAGIVKSVIETRFNVADTNEIQDLCDVAFRCYRRGLLIASGASVEPLPQAPKAVPVAVAPSPPQSVPVQNQTSKLDPKEAIDRRQEAWKFWTDNGGTVEQWEAVRAACKLRGDDYVKEILEAGLSPQDLYTCLVVVKEPADTPPHTDLAGFINDTLADTQNHREAFHKICDAEGWPDYADADVDSNRLYSEVLGRKISNIRDLTEGDYFHLHEWALRARHGLVRLPFSFKAHAKETQSA